MRRRLLDLESFQIETMTNQGLSVLHRYRGPAPPRLSPRDRERLETLEKFLEEAGRHALLQEEELTLTEQGLKDFRAYSWFDGHESREQLRIILKNGRKVVNDMLEDTVPEEEDYRLIDDLLKRVNKAARLAEPVTSGRCH
jgi:hypothetical protein